MIVIFDCYLKYRSNLIQMPIKPNIDTFLNNYADEYILILFHLNNIVAKLNLMVLV